MEIIKTKHLTESQSQQINRLWNEEYPVNLKDRFGILLDGVENYNHYLIEDERKNILAWAVDFEKGNEIRFFHYCKQQATRKRTWNFLIEST